MIRSAMLMSLLALTGLFGVFYYRSSGNTGEAARQWKQAVVKNAVANLIETRLVAEFGYDAMGYVHVYFEKGKAVVYGMSPASVTPEALAAAADGVPGVDEVEVLVHLRPAFVDTVASQQVSAPPVP